MSEKDFTLGPKKLPEAFRPSEFDVICSWARQNFSTGKIECCLSSFSMHLFIHERTHALMWIAGNKRLRSMIADNVVAYQEAGTKVRKGKIIEEIVNQVMGLSPSRAGFIRQDKETGRWSFIGFEKAKDKVGHALRQASKHTIRKRKAVHQQHFEQLQKQQQHVRLQPSIATSSALGREHTATTIATESSEEKHAAFPRSHPPHPYYWYHQHHQHPPMHPPPYPQQRQPQQQQQHEGSQSSSVKRFKPLSVETVARAPTTTSSYHAEEEEAPSANPPTSITTTITASSTATTATIGGESYHHHQHYPPRTTANHHSAMLSPRSSPTSVADVGRQYSESKNGNYAYRGGGAPAAYPPPPHYIPQATYSYPPLMPAAAAYHGGHYDHHHHHHPHPSYYGPHTTAHSRAH